MPIVELAQETQTVNLKSAPPDGFVTLRRMSHGEALRRRDGSAAMSAKEFDKQGVPSELFMASHQEWMRFYDFKLCIVDHNLQNADGSKMDFSKKDTFDRLPTTVGIEIEELIDHINGWDISPTIINGATERPLGSPVTESSQEETNPTGN